MLAYAADRGPVDHRSSGPGSSVKSMLKAPAQFGAKKDIHIPQYCQITQVRYGSLSCRCKAIIDSGICNAPLAILWGIGISIGRHYETKRWRRCWWNAFRQAHFILVVELL
jgi:hypothetical protein